MANIFLQRKRISQESLLQLILYINIVGLTFQPFYYFRIFGISIMTAVTAMCFVVISLFCKKIKITTFIKGYGLFFFWAILSMVWVTKLGIAIARLCDMAGYLFITVNITQYCLYDSLPHNIKIRCEKLMTCFLACVITITIYLYCIEGRKVFVWARLGKAIYENGGLTQIYYSCFLMCAIYIALFKTLKKHQKYRISTMAIVLFLYLSCVFTGIRKTIIVPLIFLSVFLLHRHRKNFLKLIGVIAIVSTISAGALFLILNYSSSMAYRLNNLFRGYLVGNIIEKSYNERVLLRSLAWQCYNQYPVFGAGIGQFRFYSVLHGGPDVYAHNNWLELLSCLGSIGFFIYYGNHLRLLKKGLKKNTDIACFILATVVTCFISDYYQVSYYYECFAILFAIVSCMAEI